MVIQQLREAFPHDSTHSYLIFDRATIFSEEVVGTIKSFGVTPKRTSFRSPWQNGSPNVGSATVAETCWIT
jgi:putative transposase